ncbi:MAG TPA: 4Fe-4S ferredoxin [Verrucomicrobiae bacterium]|nr:4Fe-4S ferredoxin [Verrucomicrobiae bacterium]
MSQWVRKGIRTGIKTTRYPAAAETAPGVSPGLPVGGTLAASFPAGRCPTDAIRQTSDMVAVDYRRCIHCFRCGRGVPTPLEWKPGYEWAALPEQRQNPQSQLGDAFAHSINIIVVDVGDCGACLHEVKQLNNPYYNMHRLGFFLTPTPRLADILLVVGPVTDHMRLPLQKTYDAMPTPKRVVAVGACALSGSVFGPSFVCCGGVKDVLPVDVEVPGNPPPPLAILHGLLVAVGRKQPAPIISPATAASQEVTTQ